MYSPLIDFIRTPYANMFEGLQSPSNSQDEVKGTVGMEKWGLLFGKAPGNLGILGIVQGIQRHHHQDCLRFQELGIHRAMQGLPEITPPGRKFRHAEDFQLAYSTAEKRRGQKCFTWPAWRSS